jgi:hypothetical protein
MLRVDVDDGVHQLRRHHQPSSHDVPIRLIIIHSFSNFSHQFSSLWKLPLRAETVEIDGN